MLTDKYLLVGSKIGQTLSARQFGHGAFGRQSDYFCLACIVCSWVVASLLVNPIGNFPINDDWAYGSTVRTLVEKGDVRISGWTATNFVAQMFWGALFCLPFGFSFTALRVSTLVLGLVGALSTYGMLRETRAPAGIALFGAVVLAFSPIYFSLSYTFMTDVPFTATAMASSWLLLRGLRRNSRLEVGSGLFLAAVAILIRQVGLALPIAFAAAYLVWNGLSIRRLIEALLPVAGGIILQFGFEAWLRWSDRRPASFGAQINTLYMQLQLPWPSVVSDATAIMVYSLVYAGLFLLPFLIVTQRSFLRWLHFFGLFGTATAVTFLLYTYGKLMPLHGNILHRGGLGCCDEDPSQAPTQLWIVITFAGVFGALLLVLGLFRSVFDLVFRGGVREVRYVRVFAVVAIVVAFAPLPLLGFTPHGFYDRYLIVFLPWIMVALSGSGARIEKDFCAGSLSLALGAVMLLPILAFSIAATHDHLEKSRVRWVALNRLLYDRNVKPERIDAGFEFGGLYLYDIPPEARPPGGCCWWVVGDDYYVSYLQRRSYTTLEQLNVPRWLPWGRGDIFVQSKL